MKIEIEHEGFFVLGATGGTGLPRGQAADRRDTRPGHGDDAQRRTPSGLHWRPEGLLRNGRRGGVEISRNHVGKNGARLC